MERGETADGIDPRMIATLFIGALHLEVVERGEDPPRPWFESLVETTLRAAGAH